MKTRDTTVFINGRMQAFLNYNNGDGPPPEVEDALGNPAGVLGVPEGSPIELQEGEVRNQDQGKTEDFRIRTGFVGNVLGFGFRHRLNESNQVSGYTAVTTYIDSTSRRKYAPVNPDWRESYLALSGNWGKLTAGRTLLLFNRGATDITFLYGYKYGLGWVGSVSSTGGNGPGAGMVGFGILGNGFGAGISYATPSLGGLQLEFGVFDANTLPGSGILERTRWPRGEAELTWEAKFGSTGFIKLFANGAFQKIYELDGPNSQDIAGAGFGGRFEFSVFRLGLGGHIGQGIGLNFALEPEENLWHPTLPSRKLRTVEGYSAHLQIVPSEHFDFMAAAGITRVNRLDEDKFDTVDSDFDDTDNDGLADSDPTGATLATPVFDDDGVPGPDSVGYMPLSHQIGIGAGATYHVSPHVHITAEYFRAMFNWHRAIPLVAGSEGPEQNFDLVNLGITYDF